ncbi:MAG: glycogen synthase GlgA [Lachnospiraceae bacterium]|nr:glycogen synthase GlgA [Lachnospiraceae bacterium]
MKKILFAASESVPFIKTGGLADVIGSLPKYFDKEKYDVRIVLPKYLCISEEYRKQMEYLTHFYMYYNGRNRYVGILRIDYEGIPCYFIDNEEYFGGSEPYGDHLYNLEKFGFFSKAVLAILPSIEFQPDIIHCHDWHTGLVPVYLRTQFAADEFYTDMKSIITIHNLRFQGNYSIEKIKEITGLPDYLFTPDKLEAYQDANYLKGGIVYADRVTTVSETYTEEIKTPFYGERLEGLLWARSNSLSGILNGLDYDEWNPATDPFIAQRFTISNFRQKKKKNKAALQDELGLARDPKAMMVGIVSRMTDQKGFDLIQRVMEEMVDEGIQFVVLGTGEWKYEEMFKQFAARFPRQVSANIFYSNDLSHRIYASCDAFLMPSLFEPCGLSQLMSLRYGTVPIVRETGGLKDTVEPYNEYENTGTGFSFTNYNAHEMLEAVRYAKSVYTDNKRRWNQIIDRGMAQDFSWAASAVKYEALYDEMLREEEPEADAPAEETPAEEAAEE